MIFVTIGTHPGQFDRLVRRMDEIAPEVKEEIIIQRGFTKYIPHNCKSFEFTEDIDQYYQKARLVIAQSATSLIEFAMKYDKPVITVPRQARFGEHLNDHQVEFGEYFAKKTGALCIIDMKELTSALLKSYKKKIVLPQDNLKKLQRYFTELFQSESPTEEKPFAHDRIDYMVNLINPQKTDRVLNIGISNIPEVEMRIENRVKECWTIDFDGKKLARASKFLKKTRVIRGDVTKEDTLKENYFDTVVIVEVLEHLKDDIGMIRKIRKLLKPGGKIIVGVPNDAFLHYFNPVKYFEHERHYSEEMIRERLENNGFRVTHFNFVERWTLLVNLYIHIILKFVFRINAPYGVFKRAAKNSYGQINKRGMDMLIKAVKN